MQQNGEWRMQKKESDEDVEGIWGSDGSYWVPNRSKQVCEAS